MLRESKLDLLFFTECFITEDHEISEYQFPGFQSFVAMKSRGGSCIYVQNDLPAYAVHPPNAVEDSTWVVITTKEGTKRLYGCIYRSPNSSHSNNRNLIENIRWAKTQYLEIILVGDFNLPTINWDSLTCDEAYGESFLETLDDCGYEQLIDECTRYRHGQNPSILDLIICSHPDALDNIKVAEAFGKSDHCRIEFDVKNCCEPLPECSYKYDFRKMNEEIFLEEMNRPNWDNVFSGDLEEGYIRFLDIVSKAIDRSTPLMNTYRKTVAPWSNEIIAKLAKKKREKWDKYKYSRTEANYTRYKDALEKFNIEKEKAVEYYENQIICNKNVNQKRYYRYVSSKSKYCDSKVSLIHEGEITADSKKCACIFGDYFASVFTRGVSDSEVDMSKIRPAPDMLDIEIGEEDIRAVLDEIDMSKAAGPDDIPASLLKRFSSVFLPVLALIFRKSYNEGIVPKEMKSANIIPIHKSGNKTEPGNYRPVSLTPIIAKLFESIMKKYIEAHVERYQILSEYQHGFRKGHSTSSNLISFTNDLANLANDSKSISIIYTDLRKAFDSVPHDLLLKKLKHLGIAGLTHRWLQSFLTDRQQRVRVGNEYSSYISVKSGVPQGAVLSGLLFALYVNDLPAHIENSKISLYADDAKVYSEITDNNSVRNLQSDINKMLAWCQQWRLSLNPDKCYLLQYNPRARQRQFNPTYQIGNVPIQSKTEVRDLGILISQDLKYHSQVDAACKKAHKEINRIRRSFKSRSPNFIKNMYKLYVRPRLEYCVEVWNPKYLGDIKKMEKVQNKMTKLARNCHNQNPNQRNLTLGLLTHEKRRLRGDLINTWKHIEDESLFTLRNDTRVRGHDKTIRVPRSNILIKKHSFSTRSIDVWNSLPSEIVNTSDLNSFKRDIDSYMF